MHAAMVPESLRKKQTRSGEWAVANKIKIGSLKKKDVGNRKRASSRFVLVDQLLYADTEDENDGLNLDLQIFISFLKNFSAILYTSMYIEVSIWFSGYGFSHIKCSGCTNVSSSSIVSVCLWKLDLSMVSVRHEKGVGDRFGLYDEAPKSKAEHERGRKDVK
nr:hypothetical protein [Tanacetum cinerariifolium]